MKTGGCFPCGPEPPASSLTARPPCEHREYARHHHQYNPSHPLIEKPRQGHKRVHHPAKPHAHREPYGHGRSARDVKLEARDEQVADQGHQGQAEQPDCDDQPVLGPYPPVPGFRGKKIPVHHRKSGEVPGVFIVPRGVEQALGQRGRAGGKRSGFATRRPAQKQIGDPNGPHKQQRRARGAQDQRAHFPARTGTTRRRSCLRFVHGSRQPETTRI